LGDICVSLPTKQHGGVVQYDLGRMETDGFHRLGMLNKPPKLRAAVMNLRVTRGIENRITAMVNKAFEDGDDDEYMDEERTYPATAPDVLFQATFDHIKGNANCIPCAKNAEEIVGAG
jgi:hypothetical protein